MNSIKIGISIAALLMIGILLVPISEISANDLILTPNNASIGNIVIVSPKAPSSALANGAALLNAVAAINDATASNKYLITIGPGTFDLGAGTLNMKSYVDIEGSGKELTVITSSADLAGTLAGTNLQRSTLSKLGINNTGANYAYAIVNDSGMLFVEDVNINASNSNGAGYSVGIINISSNLTLKNSYIWAWIPFPYYGYAILNTGTPSHIVQIMNSILAASTAEVNNAAGYLAVNIAFTQLNVGSLNSGAGVFSCFQNYNSNFGPAVCP
jgi:hypothetical protein